MVPLTERFEMRLDEETLRRVDEWRNSAGYGVSRSEAIRRLIDLGLDVKSTDSVHFSDGEKLLLLMMRDLFRHLGMEHAESDPDFIAKVIFGGHFWAPTWRLTGVFHGHRDDPRNVSFVVDVLDMWTFLERGHQGLSAEDRAKVAESADPFGKHVEFRGFDGNSEAELIGIARFLIDDLDRFSTFRGRELNSHYPTVNGYRRMLEVFLELRPQLVGVELNTGQIIRILQAWRRP